jgi:hypothetical protein
MVKGEHIALVSAPHPDSNTLSTEPLIIQAHLSGIEAQKKLLLLDSGSDAPLLYDAGRLGRGLVVSAPLHSRNADGVEQAFTVLPFSGHADWHTQVPPDFLRNAISHRQRRPEVKSRRIAPNDSLPACLYQLRGP